MFKEIIEIIQKHPLEASGAAVGTLALLRQALSVWGEMIKKKTGYFEQLAKDASELRKENAAFRHDLDDALKEMSALRKDLTRALIKISHLEDELQQSLKREDELQKQIEAVEDDCADR